MSPGPDLRIGDAERERAAGILRDHFADGRLTHEEFQQRLDAVFAARRQSDLDALTADLPHAAAPGAVPVPAAGQRQGRSDGGPGQRTGSADRHRMLRGPLPVPLALLVAVMVAFGWFLPHHTGLFMIPGLRSFFPGRLAIFLIVFALVRSALRRIWGGGRGPRRRRW
jgi:hypothetical protein